MKRARGLARCDLCLHEEICHCCRMKTISHNDDELSTKYRQDDRFWFYPGEFCFRTFSLCCMQCLYYYYYITYHKYYIIDMFNHSLCRMAKLLLGIFQSTGSLQTAVYGADEVQFNFRKYRKKLQRNCKMTHFLVLQLQHVMRFSM